MTQFLIQLVANGIQVSYNYSELGHDCRRVRSHRRGNATGLSAKLSRLFTIAEDCRQLNSQLPTRRLTYVAQLTRICIVGRFSLRVSVLALGVRRLHTCYTYMLADIRSNK
jgi:hypothetical protein